MARVSIILPTYNERESITALIAHLLELVEGAEVVVVDDDSPDATAQAVEEAFGGNEQVKLIVRKGERGLATAIWRGIQATHSPLIGLMDSDFNHRPEDMARLVKAAEETVVDIAIGSRFRRGGGMEGARVRWFFSWAFNLWLRLVLGVRTTDNLSGFMVIRREVLEQLGGEELFVGYGDYAIRLLKRAQAAGLKIKEIPVVYGPRMGGESKTRFVHHLIQYTRTALELRRKGW